jgi:hypothetical protein
MRTALVRVLAVLGGGCIAATAVRAQAAGRPSAVSTVEVAEAQGAPGELLAPAEQERIACSMATDDDVFEIRRRGAGWFPTTEGVYALTYRVQLTGSKRTVTVGLDQGRRPRLLMAVWTVDDRAGGGIESVVVRFLPNGEVRDGRRTREPARRDSADAATPSGRTDLYPEDGILAYTLARELGFRCDRGIWDPLAAGEIWTRIPIP